MATIDAHQHFWWVARRTHSWPDAVAGRMSKDFTPDELIPELKRAGVDGTVLVQSLNDYDESREYIELADEYPFIRGVVGWVPLADPAKAVQSLAGLGGRGKLVGIRHVLAVEPDPDWLLWPQVMDSLGVLSDGELVFDAVPMNFRQLEPVFTVAERLPSLKIVINHFLRPPIIEQGWEPWASIVERAAAYPNIAVKLSIGIDIVTRWHWKVEMVQRYADHLIKSFGPGRVLAGSNWPVVLMGASYAEIWGGIEALLTGLSPADRKLVLGGAAERIYGLA